MAFTSDNKYLLSAHKYANSLLVWNIVDNELYKKFNINT